MTPGTIVICTDARLSEGRLVEGWRYPVQEMVYAPFSGTDDRIVPRNEMAIVLVGCPAPDGGSWKSSRFRPLERKDVEDKVNRVIADKILDELVKEK